ncbi:MAG: hypothetical protein L0I48_04160 [Lactococcus plantarum]|nr:hypothetical protein [Lactococcus plantarum]MDN6070373.1 hypothetical protein [Lactococcus plantarum]MDN6084092.1 hypothetical protein [Lactococcus plantarum]
MTIWTNAIVDRVEAAYSVRFDKEEALIFLNDAYQNLLMLELKMQNEDNEKLNSFIDYFVSVRDSFITELVDRYPSNYTDIKTKIDTLRKLNEQVLSVSQEVA